MTKKKKRKPLKITTRLPPWGATKQAADAFEEIRRLKNERDAAIKALSSALPDGPDVRLAWQDASMEASKYGGERSQLLGYAFLAIRRVRSLGERVGMLDAELKKAREFPDAPTSERGQVFGIIGPPPVPMLIWCPECSERHIDEGEFATKIHHTHSCQVCGHTWRPAVVPTVGVKFLPGFKNEVGRG